MRRIPDIYAAGREAGRPVISVEFFPPKTPEGDARLFGRVLPALAAVRPDFYSVTCGAGGSGVRTRTLQIVDRMQREHGMTAMAHVTCVSFTHAEMDGFLDEAADWASGTSWRCAATRPPGSPTSGGPPAASTTPTS